MEQLQKAIENITYRSKKFPEKEFEIISANPDAAIPYLRSAVEKAIEEKEELDENYNLHFFAIYLLAQFQDREFFPKLMELMCLPPKTLDYLIGDTITEHSRSILYNTYNGDLQLLKQAICDKEVDDYARSAMLDVMGQLYLDQTLSRQEWQDFLRELVYHEEPIGDYIYTAIAYKICKCHFIEMLPELRHLYRDECIDESAIGGYDACIDYMFEYRERDKAFCKSPIEAAKCLNGWAMFEEPSIQKENIDKEFSKMFDEITSGMNKPVIRENAKVGRNDPCPCGSGKKYKKCCMNKPQNIETMPESPQERERWLKYYPKAKTEEQEGRIYLEDFYSQESIEIDKLLYLALKHRVIPIFQREPQEVVSQRQAVYLTDAFNRFKEIIERENIQSFSEYDSRYSIHYFCEEWTEELCSLLQEREEWGILQQVKKVCERLK